MKLSDVRAAYDYFTGKVSELSRNLAFAGIAIVWVFRRGTDAAPLIRAELIRPALLFCWALAFDLAHYVVAAAAWGAFHRRAELQLKKVGENPALEAPSWINWPQNTFFVLKLLFVAAGYAILLQFLTASLPENSAASPAALTSIRTLDH